MSFGTARHPVVRRLRRGAPPRRLSGARERRSREHRGARHARRARSRKIAEHDTTSREQQLGAADTATIARSTDTSITNARPSTLRIGSLDPLADSISDRMVFLATTQTTFLAATRGKRLLLDLGRFDGAITTAKQRKAFEAAALVLSPVRIGDQFALRGVWGADTASLTGYALWNGRIVGTLAVEKVVDSLAKSGAHARRAREEGRAGHDARRTAPRRRRDSAGGAPDARAAGSRAPRRSAGVVAPMTAADSAAAAALARRSSRCKPRHARTKRSSCASPSSRTRSPPCSRRTRRSSPTASRRR